MTMLIVKRVEVLVQFGDFLNIEIFRRGFYSLDCRVYYGSEAEQQRRDASLVTIISTGFAEKTEATLKPTIRHYETCQRGHICNWRCRDQQTVFSSQVFRIDVQGETVPLESAALFAVEVPVLQKSDGHYNIFAEVDLYFLDTEKGTEVTSHSHLKYQQTRRFKFKNVLQETDLSAMSIIHSHSMVQFDGIFVASCDLLVSASFTGYLFKTDEEAKAYHAAQRPKSTQNSSMGVLEWMSVGVAASVTNVDALEIPTTATPASLKTLLLESVTILRELQRCISQSEAFQELDHEYISANFQTLLLDNVKSNCLIMPDAKIVALVAVGLTGNETFKQMEEKHEISIAMICETMADQFMAQNEEQDVIPGLIRVIDLLSSKLQCVWMIFSSDSGILSSLHIQNRRLLATSERAHADLSFLTATPITAEQEFVQAVKSASETREALLALSQSTHDCDDRKAVIITDSRNHQAEAEGSLLPLFSKARTAFLDSIKNRDSVASSHSEHSLKSLLADFPLPPHFFKHLIVFVHGLFGNSFDMTMYRNQVVHSLRCLGFYANDQAYLVSAVNEADTLQDIGIMADRLVSEIRAFIREKHINVERISFVCHSLGGIIARCAIQTEGMASFQAKLESFVSFSSPHASLYFHSNALMISALRVYQLIGQSKSLDQLNLKDDPNPRKCLLYKLAQNESNGLAKFRNVRFFGSHQDGYVPIDSALVDASSHLKKREENKISNAENPLMNEVFVEMAEKINNCGNIEKFAVQFGSAYPITLSSDSLIGRTAHIAFLTDKTFLNLASLICKLHN
ncbi:putative serine esterase-domain-containing protein [Chytriomyces sp. MP71]|nr:putative serine esterase-domain-containing protein [Chytriomyces sp. MP71]